MGLYPLRLGLLSAARFRFQLLSFPDTHEKRELATSRQSPHWLPVLLMILVSARYGAMRHSSNRIRCGPTMQLHPVGGVIGC
jgi:hypothetical protein